MGPRFLCGQIAISNLKHVKIIMAEEVAVLEEENAVVNDRHFTKSVWTTDIATRREFNGLLNPHE